MSFAESIDQILDKLLDNALELQEASDNDLFHTQLTDQQRRLLDTLFEQWDQMNQEERVQAFESKLESKIERFAKQNQACLKEVF